MITLAFAVYDSAVKAFNTPLFFRSKGEAIRSFTDACNDEKSNFNKHYGDYSFFCLGEYDDQNGSFKMLTAPEKVISAAECIDDQIFPPDKRMPM